MVIKLLSEMQHTEQGKIVKIRGKPDLHKRAYSMGLAVGATVEVRNVHRHNGSIQIKIGESELLLDNDAALNIQVEIYTNAEKRKRFFLFPHRTHVKQATCEAQETQVVRRVSGTEKLTAMDVDVSGKRVLARVDFNVPLDSETGEITDDGRIKATLPTIKYLIDNGAKIILCSHMGRPAGKVIEELRMVPVAFRLSQLLGREVQLVGDCIGPEVEEKVRGMKAGDIILLENLRFHMEEEANDPAFAQALSRLAEIYVNDAFGVSHRPHASIVSIANHIPAVAGLLLEKEMAVLGTMLHEPAHPFAALVGGAKVSDKVAMLENLMCKIDVLLVGGAIVALFLEQKNLDSNYAISGDDDHEVVSRIIDKANNDGTQLLLPVDIIVSNESGSQVMTVPADNIPTDFRVVDLGPESIERYARKLSECRTVFWNGPLGISEMPQFAQGTRSIAQVLARLDANTIIGGGSTAELVANMGLSDAMSFVSTGGGASLSFLEGSVLPGIQVLLNKKE